MHVHYYYYYYYCLCSRSLMFDVRLCRVQIIMLIALIHLMFLYVRSMEVSVSVA